MGERSSRGASSPGVYSFSSIVISNVSLIMSKELLQFYCIMFPIRRIPLFASFISHRNKVIQFCFFTFYTWTKRSLRHEEFTRRSPNRPANATNEKEGISVISTAFTSNVTSNTMVYFQTTIKPDLETGSYRLIAPFPLSSLKGDSPFQIH